MADDIENDTDIADYFEDEEALDIFKAQLEVGGIVASVVPDNGVLLGFSVEKLQELLKLAQEQQDKLLVIMLSGGSDEGEAPNYDVN